VPVADPLDVLEEDERRSRKWIWWLLALLVLAGVAVGAYLAFQPEERAVPKVVGLRGERAAQVLNNAGFEVDIETVQSEKVRRNRVVSQRPGAGTRLEEGATVTIRVSSGRGEAAVPDVVGDGRRQAERRLRQAGFKPRVEQRFSEDVRRDRVIGTRPRARTLLEKGRTVVVVVSRGIERVEVPDVTGLDREAAQNALRERDFGVVVREQESDAEDPGEVLRQDPAPGTRLAKEETVTIVVAVAPPEPEPGRTGRGQRARRDRLDRRGSGCRAAGCRLHRPPGDRARRLARRGRRRARAGSRACRPA
jgi:serine/threonine-protein kinase